MHVDNARRPCSRQTACLLRWGRERSTKVYKKGGESQTLCSVDFSFPNEHDDRISMSPLVRSLWRTAQITGYVRARREVDRCGPKGHSFQCTRRPDQRQDPCFPRASKVAAAFRRSCSLGTPMSLTIVRKEREGILLMPTMRHESVLCLKITAAWISGAHT